MNKSRRSLILFLAWFIILSHQIPSVVCERGQHDEEAEEKPSLFHVVSSTISLLKKSHQSSWEKIKTVIRELQLQFTPPNLDFRATGGTRGSEGVGENMKEAVKKSIGTSKVTVEETAKSAAEAVHETAEKLKESVSDSSGNEESHDEL